MVKKPLVCGISPLHVLLYFINIYVCLHQNQSQKKPTTKSEIVLYVDTLWLLQKSAFSCQIRGKKNVMRNISVPYAANSSFIEMTSNGWNPY